jgi:hypothetical protein
MYKIDKIVNPILIDKGPHWWYFFIWGKKIEIWIGKGSIKFLKGLINFIEDLIARKINFKVNLGLKWKKIKFQGRIAILKS